jgi:hypothetical protein
MSRLAHAGGRSSDAVGPTFKASSYAPPLFNHALDEDLGLYSLVFFLCPCVSLLSPPSTSVASPIQPGGSSEQSSSSTGSSYST